MTTKQKPWRLEGIKDTGESIIEDFWTLPMAKKRESDIRKLGYRVDGIRYMRNRKDQSA